jgi:hypothetical protein
MPRARFKSSGVYLAGFLYSGIVAKFKLFHLLKFVIRVMLLRFLRFDCWHKFKG